MGIKTKAGEDQISKLRAKARVSLYAFPPPEVYIPHILNRTIQQNHMTSHLGVKNRHAIKSINH